MTKLCVLGSGRLFGLAILGVSAFACSGKAFTGSAPEQSEPANTADATNKGVIPKRDARPAGSGGNTTSTTGGSAGELDGGAASIHPEPPLAGTGGTAGASTTAGTASVSATAGAGGRTVQLPEQGMAGEPNIPDPPSELNCAAPLAETWAAVMDSASSSWRVEFGDPWIDTANHRLVVTYDDVASRKVAYEGGYYVTAEVTLEGGTVLTPYPYSNEKRWPSLRRSSNGSSVELGATAYGPTSWSSDDWPNFSGTVISGTTQVVITSYVKATAQAFALKVSSGGHSYRSGWVSGFTWDKTNLGIMRYVGENNSAVYSGDAVYVGPLSGCQGLSDESVQAAFDD